MLVLDSEQPRVVVEKADGPQAQLGIAHQLTDDEPAALAATDHQHLAPALAGGDAADPALAEQLHGEAGADEQRQREQEEQHDDAGGRQHAGARGPAAGVRERSRAE